MAKSLETGRAHEKAYASAENQVNKLQNFKRKPGNSNQGGGRQQWQGNNKNFKKNFGQRTSQNGGNQNQRREVQKCYRCNNTGHFAKSPTCPARNATCRKCHNRGHYAECCRTRDKVNQITTAEDNSTEEIHENFTFSLRFGSQNNLVEIQLGGVKLDVLADLGANVNVVDSETWKYLKSQGIRCKSWKYDGVLYPYGHADGLPVIGKFTTRAGHNQESVETIFLVFEGRGQPILGLDSAEKLGVMRLNVHTLKTASPKLYEGVGK